MRLVHVSHFLWGVNLFRSAWLRLVALTRRFSFSLSYLPPDSEFLSSPWDFPEIFLCLFQDCPSHHAEENFLTFFSGNLLYSFYLSIEISDNLNCTMLIPSRACGDNCKLVFRNMLALLRPPLILYFFLSHISGSDCQPFVQCKVYSFVY